MKTRILNAIADVLPAILAYVVGVHDGEKIGRMFATMQYAGSIFSMSLRHDPSTDYWRREAYDAQRQVKLLRRVGLPAVAIIVGSIGYIVGVTT